MNHQETTERDELRARFTTWLETVTYHARLKYLKQQSRQVRTISLEELPEDALSVPAPSLHGEALKMAFDFEEERLARAFAGLTIKRQQDPDNAVCGGAQTGRNRTAAELLPAARLRPTVPGAEKAA